MMKYAFYLTLPLFALASCGGSSETEVLEDDVEVVETAPEVSALPATPGVSLNETVDAVNSAGGITNLDPTVATGVIDGWIAKLSSTPGTSGITGDLQTLKSELTSGNIDGSRVGALLTKLGNESRALAPDNAALGNLASALEAGGSKLSGM